MKQAIEANWQPPSYYFHLQRGGHVAALQQHAGGALFVKVDITDFFGSISRSRIARVLKQFLSHAEALRMATASTVQHPADTTRKVLPYGFIQSPLLASLVLHKSGLGKYLDELHESELFTVTVYMDDIIVSGDDHEALQEVLSQLKLKAERSGLSLSDEKEQGPAASIDAFNIKLSAAAPLALAPPKLDEFRMVFRTSTSTLQKAGVQGYVRSVNPDQADSLPP